MEGNSMEEFQIPTEALEKLRDPDIIRRQINEGKTFQEILGYNQESMQKFYTIAHNLYQKQEYEKAADAFIFLTTLNPYVHNYWLGLGMSEQLNHNFQSALLAYAMAILTNVEDPLAHYQSGNCYLALGDKVNAAQSFEMAIRCAGENLEYGHVKERAELAKKESEKTS